MKITIECEPQELCDFFVRATGGTDNGETESDGKTIASRAYDTFVHLLQKRGLTAYKVSQETGISQSTLSDWKTGRATPKADKLLVLARFFGVPVEYFLTEEEKN